MCTQDSLRLYLQVLGSELGRGGFGVVFLALNTTNGQSVAVKRLALKSMSREDVDSTQGEIALLKQLEHPHIVPFMDLLYDKDFMYIVLE